ncbi:MAG TPA: GTPase Era [Gemmatimonadaceae bacterium]|nr:GTPase Era [Gemmatimonadaceae bacterium]
MTRAGIVTVAGKPNAGKSTLLNRIIGQKLSIVSSKPQSTRDRIVGIHSENDVQMIVLDTPGLLNPAYPLQHAMRAAALDAVGEADVLIHLVDASAETPTPFVDAAGLSTPPRAPIVLALNKVDALSDEGRARMRERYSGAHLISAITGEGVGELLASVGALLPESPFLYPDDEISTQAVRFFVSELIRETALEQLEDEVPYSVASAVEEYREGRKPVYIRAVLYVERESQKRILIGAKGDRIREIGRASRLKIEELVGEPVYLDLWVKVLSNWRKNATALHRLGYRLPKEHTQ